MYQHLPSSTARSAPRRVGTTSTRLAMPRTPADVFIGRYVEAGTARWREAALADVVEQQASMGISQVDPEAIALGQLVVDRNAPWGGARTTLGVQEGH